MDVEKAQEFFSVSTENQIIKLLKSYYYSGYEYLESEIFVAALPFLLKDKDSYEIVNLLVKLENNNILLALKDKTIYALVAEIYPIWERNGDTYLFETVHCDWRIQSIDSHFEIYRVVKNCTSICSGREKGYCFNHCPEDYYEIYEDQQFEELERQEKMELEDLE